MKQNPDLDILGETLLLLNTKHVVITTVYFCLFMFALVNRKVALNSENESLLAC